MSMQPTLWTPSGNVVQSYWRTGSVWSAYCSMTHCQERKVCLCSFLFCSAYMWHWAKTEQFLLCSSYRQTGDSFDWDHAVHCTAGCWMPPTCRKRNREEGKIRNIANKHSAVDEDWLNNSSNIVQHGPSCPVTVWLSLARTKSGKTKCSDSHSFSARPACLRQKMKLRRAQVWGCCSLGHAVAASHVCQRSDMNTNTADYMNWHHTIGPVMLTKCDLVWM